MAQQDGGGGSADTGTVYMLTTVDNPYNPFTDWDEWYAFDARQGYHTPGLIDRLTFDSHELSEADQTLSVQLAIGEIARTNALGIYRLVTEDSFTTGVPIPENL
jgi:hypothetical protein